MQEYLTGVLSKREIWEKYTGEKQEHGQILRWMREFGYENQTLLSNNTNFAEIIADMAKKTKSTTNKPPVRRSVNFDNLRVRRSVSLCRSYTDCTNNIAQFRQSLIVLLVCPAMRDVPYASRNTQSALTTVNIVNDFGSFYMYSWYKKESSSFPYSNQKQGCALPEQQKHQKRNAMHLACSARLRATVNR